MNYIELGSKVHAARIRLNLTQEQLAELIGVSTSFTAILNAARAC